MRNLLLITGMGVLLYFVFIATLQTNLEQTALVLETKNNFSVCLDQVLKNNLAVGQSQIKVRPTHINTDNTLDAILEIDSDDATDTCQTSQCRSRYELCLSNDSNVAELVEINVRADKVDLATDLHNGMHDIIIDDAIRYTWNGTQYGPVPE